MEKKKAVTIILAGRTGVGKSSLANKIAQKELFKVGDSLVSETEFVSSETISLPNHPHIEVRIIDTPGFGDNRVNVTNEKLLSRILSFITNLENGLNIVLFCLNAKTRVDSHDTDELDMLGLLLGSELYNHVYIVITQGNTLVQDQKEKIQNNFKKDLPRILTEHGLPLFPQERILFADFDNFDQFMGPLTKKIPTSEVYKPQIAQGVDPKNPESIARFLQTPEMKKIMEEYEQKVEEQRRKMASMESTITEQKRKIEQTIEQNRVQQQSIQNHINSLNNQLSQKDSQNKALVTQFEAEKQRQTQQLNEVNQRLTSLSEQKDKYQTQLNAKLKQVENLNKKIDELEKIRSQPQIICTGRDRGGCNLM